MYPTLAAQIAHRVGFGRALPPGPRATTARLAHAARRYLSASCNGSGCASCTGCLGVEGCGPACPRLASAHPQNPTLASGITLEVPETLLLMLARLLQIVGGATCIYPALALLWAVGRRLSARAPVLRAPPLAAILVLPVELTLPWPCPFPSRRPYHTPSCLLSSPRGSFSNCKASNCSLLPDKITFPKLLRVVPPRGRRALPNRNTPPCAPEICRPSRLDRWLLANSGTLGSTMCTPPPPPPPGSRNPLGSGGVPESLHVGDDVVPDVTERHNSIVQLQFGSEVWNACLRLYKR